MATQQSFDTAVPDYYRKFCGGGVAASRGECDGSVSPFTTRQRSQSSRILRVPTNIYRPPPSVSPIELRQIIEEMGISGHGFGFAPGVAASESPKTVFAQARLAIRDGILGRLSKPWPVLPFHPVQQAASDSNAIFVGFTGGRGAGKSRWLCQSMIEAARGGRYYSIIGPTYPSLRDTTFRTFMEIAGRGTVQFPGLNCICRDSKGKPRVNKQAFSVEIDTKDGGVAVFNFRSADRPESCRGPNLSGIGLDEASLMCEDIFLITIACLREGGSMGFMKLGFTPLGKGHWTYGLFFDKHGNPKSDTELFRAATKDNPFLSREFLRVMSDKYVEGSTIARQELGGEFVDLGGLMFQRGWFTLVGYDDLPGPEAVRVRYWDKAATEQSGSSDPDYTAGALVSRCPKTGRFFIEHVIRGQWSPAKRNSIIRQVAKTDKERYGGRVQIWIEQEPGSGGKESALISLSELAEHPVHIETVSGKGNKIVRAQPLQAQAEVGNVYCLEDGWAEDSLSELAAFPEGKHDDVVDAVAGSYNKVAILTGSGFGMNRPLVLWPAEEPKDGDGEDGKEDGRGVKPETPTASEWLSGEGANGNGSGNGNKNGKHTPTESSSANDNGNEHSPYPPSQNGNGHHKGNGNGSGNGHPRPRKPLPGSGEELLQWLSEYGNGNGSVALVEPEPEPEVSVESGNNGNGNSPPRKPPSESLIQRYAAASD